MAPPTTKEELLRLIDQERNLHLDFLSNLVRIPSANPPGDTRDTVRFVEDHLRKHGVSSERIAPRSDAPNIVSRFSGEAAADPPRNLVLNGHIDCFPVNADEKWQREPYSGEIADGFVHGRGGVDMKAGTAADIIAFTYLHRYRAQLSGQCTLEVVSDEETGGRYGTRYLLEQDARQEEWRGSCVLNAEPSGMESVRFAEKGTLRLTFEVQTRGAHGAYLHLTEGAIRIATRLIDRLVGLEQVRGEGMDPALHDYLQRADVREVADRAMGEGAADSMIKPTVNIGTIRGGVKINMIPSYCAFEADIRLPIGLVKEKVLENIDEILQDVPEASYTIHEAATNSSFASPLEHELLDLIQQNAAFVRGVKPLAISSMGATDCKHFRRNGIPAYSYGPSPETMADKDERVSVQEYLDVIKIHTVAAWDYLGGRSE